MMYISTVLIFCFDLLTSPVHLLTVQCNSLNDLVY